MDLAGGEHGGRPDLGGKNLSVSQRRMTQPRRYSLLESVTNVSVGYLVAFCGQLAIFPLVGIEVHLHQNLTISAFFTALSLVRSYVLRRVFNGIRPVDIAWDR